MKSRERREEKRRGMKRRERRKEKGNEQKRRREGKGKAERLPAFPRAAR